MWKKKKQKTDTFCGSHLEKLVSKMQAVDSCFFFFCNKRQKKKKPSQVQFTDEEEERNMDILVFSFLSFFDNNKLWIKSKKYNGISENSFFNLVINTQKLKT